MRPEIHVMVRLWWATLCAAAALLIISPALAGVAIGQPNLAQSELNFIKAVAAQGYSGDNYRTVQAGYKVCSLLDKGMSHEGIERFVIDTFDEQRHSASYYATLFAQYATYNLCPRHLDEYGPI